MRIALLLAAPLYLSGRAALVLSGRAALVLSGRAALVLSGIAALVLSANAALANPNAVVGLLGKAGQAGVARGPSTVDDATKKEIEGFVRKAAEETGAKFHVVLVDKDSELAPYAAVYGDLGMGGKDVLVVSNGAKWDLRCNALTAEQKKTVLHAAMSDGGKPLARMERLVDGTVAAVKEARPVAKAGASTGKAMTWNEFEQANAGKGWNGAQMSAAYQKYRRDGGALATTASTEVASKTDADTGSSSWLFPGLFALAIGGVVTWIVLRRRKRDAGLADELKKALHAPETTMSDVYMNLDGLENHPNFGRLMDAATGVSDKLSTLKSAAPTRANIAQAQALREEAQRVRTQFDNARQGR